MISSSKMETSVYAIVKVILLLQQPQRK